MKKILPVMLLLISCTEESRQPIALSFTQKDTLNEDSSLTVKMPSSDTSKIIPVLEKKMKDAGLVNIHSQDSSIAVDLKYSSVKNFLSEDVYGDLCECYLQKEVAFALASAQYYLKKIKPAYSLIAYDCARPLSVQQLMWQKAPIDKAEKKSYLANPRFGSLHNYGAAADVSIVDENGNELDMGSPFDDLSELSHPILESKFLQEEKLTQQQVDNRKMLRAVMFKAGFFNIQTEWWHFNYCTREVAEERFEMIQ